MISLESIPYILLAAAAIAFFAWSEHKHAIESARKERLIADLMDRLMSRDVGEYTMVRQERNRPDKPVAPEHYETEEENVLAFQAMGEDWQSPSEWMKGYKDEIARSGGAGGGGQ